jgi:hypothetical protein
MSSTTTHTDPTAAVWGPSLWRILHVLGEKHTNRSHNYLVHALLEHLGHLLPCRICREHFQKYWRENRLPRTQWEPSTLRAWLWKLHDTVNASRGVESDIGADDVPYMYAGKDLSADFKILYNSIQTAWLRGSLSYGTTHRMTDFRHTMERLRFLLGLTRGLPTDDISVTTSSLPRMRPAAPAPAATPAVAAAQATPVITPITVPW